MRILFTILSVLLLAGCFKSEEPSVTDITEELSVIIDNETWMNVFLLGEKIGYTENTIKNTFISGTEYLNFSSYSFLKIQRFTEEIIIENTANEFTDYNLNPVQFTFLKSDSQSGKETVHGTILGNTLEITVLSNIDEQHKTYTLPEDFSFESTEKCRMIIKGLSPGLNRSFSIYDPEELEFVSVSVEVLGKMHIEYNNNEIEVFEIRSTYKYNSEISVTEYVTEEGETLKIDMSSLGIYFEAVSKEEAVSDFKGYGLLEIFIPVDDFIPLSVKKLELELITEDPSLIDLFPEDDYQKTDRENMNISITEYTPEDSIGLPYDFNENTLPFINPTRFIQSDDEAIINLAHEITGGEKNIWTAASKIYFWLTENIEGSYEISFASAKEVLELRKGDCTEYSVLFAALARAYGIPAKVCVGMVYNQTNGFVLHAWNEVFTGKWQPVDSALGQLYPDATHIKVYSGVMDSIMEYSLNVQKLMGKISFKVVSYEM
jgi:hypothetical protein